MFHLTFAIVGAALNILAGASYIKATLKGLAQPNRVTWFLWALAPLIAAAAQFASRVGVSTLIVFMGGFVPLCVFLASFAGQKAYWKLEKFDYLCGILSISALIFWAITKNPIIAIMLSILSDALATMPTLKKAYLHPHTEDKRNYLIGMLGAFLGLLSVTQHSIAGYAFNVYLCIQYLSIVSLLYRNTH